MFTEGDTIGARTLDTIAGDRVSVPTPGRIVHLQFRRFAGCPICNLHLQQVARRNAEIEAAGIDEVVVFHSTADRLREYVRDVPFALVADPQRELYVEFGVESSFRSVLHVDAVRAAVRGIRHNFSLPGALAPKEDHLGKPADFLIEPDGTVRASKYGQHADDQWTVDEMLALARDR